MMTLEDIRSEIIALSGSGKKVATTRHHGIYTSFTLPGLTDLRAVRDTRIRFDDFHVEQDLRDKTWLDVGSNVGGMAFEAARRGARVTGLEYRTDRVALTNEMAKFWGEPSVGVTQLEMWQHRAISEASFYVEDFNRVEVVVNRGPHDYVLCSSVDEYIDDRPSFYKMLRHYCGGQLLLESNIQRGVAEIDTISALRDAGFVDIKYLGNGHSGGISRKRKLFTARVR